jgi:hypothetical protein
LQTGEVTQKKIFVLLLDYRCKSKEMHVQAVLIQAQLASE